MKNLLNNAVEELMVRVNNELEDMRKDMNITMSINAKARVIKYRKENIMNLIDKLWQLEKHMEKVFPDDYEEAKQIREFIHKTDLRLLDEMYVSYGCY